MGEDQGQSNLFDASNLRTRIRLKKLINDINVKESNYIILQTSRSNNLALSVDEERFQAYYTAFALYKFGFRAIPIITWTELDYLSKDRLKNLNLIIRDYDLQFEDLPTHKTDACVQCGDSLYMVDNLRGIHNCKAHKNCADLYQSFWNKYFSAIPIWFVSRLQYRTLRQMRNEVFLLESYLKPPEPREYNNAMICNDYTSRKSNSSGIRISGPVPYLRGITKPVSGISEFMEIDIIALRERDLTHDKREMIITRKDRESHSAPADILHIGESLLRRSKAAYNNGMYIVSAVLAQETLEILNGFHLLLMLDALFQKYVAETRIETENIGIKDLTKNVRVKIKEIKLYAKRVCGENKKAYNNTLKQIFNEIRHIYREKEQFDAADRMLKELICVKD